MTKLSFGFIVGGGDSYYKNLMRACESLERIKELMEINETLRNRVDKDDKLIRSFQDSSIVDMSKMKMKE